MKIEGMGQYNPQSSINTAKQVSDDTGFGTALERAFDEKDKTKLKEACTDFETILLKMLYSKMKATVPKGGLTEESTARGIFQDMLDDELMARSGMRGVGVADMMYKQLSARMDRTYKAADKTEAQTDVQEKTESTNTDENGAEPVEK